MWDFVADWRHTLFFWWRASVVTLAFPHLFLAFPNTGVRGGLAEV